MTVKVLLFASYAEALGASSIDVDLPAGSTVADLVKALRARGGSMLPAIPLVAVNEEYARPHDIIRASDEVAVIPPVAGG